MAGTKQSDEVRRSGRKEKEEVADTAGVRAGDAGGQRRGEYLGIMIATMTARLGRGRGGESAGERGLSAGHDARQASSEGVLERTRVGVAEKSPASAHCGFG